MEIAMQQPQPEASMEDAADIQRPSTDQSLLTSTPPRPEQDNQAQVDSSGEVSHSRSGTNGTGSHAPAPAPAPVPARSHTRSPIEVTAQPVPSSASTAAAIIQQKLASAGATPRAATPATPGTPATATSIAQPVQHPKQQHLANAPISVPATVAHQPRTTPSYRTSVLNEFPSPNNKHDDQKFNQDVVRLRRDFQDTSAAAVRRVVRDRWEKALLGSEFHLAFLLNAVIHHANGVILRKGIKEFGSKMVSESRHEVIDHFTRRDLDDVADTIIGRASDQFLDKALEKRLKNIDARSLINALARAERLGYEGSDIMENKATTAASSSTAQKSPAQPPLQTPVQPSQQFAELATSQPPAQPPIPTARPQAPNPALECRLCWRKFSTAGPYEYHVQKQLCSKAPPNANGYPFACEHCGAGFITKVGQQYHLNNKVCTEYRTTHAISTPALAAGPPTPRASMAFRSPVTISSGNSSPAPAAAPLPQHYPSTQQQNVPTPVQQNRAVVQHHVMPLELLQQQDPYARLNPKTRARLEEELKLAEVSYAPRFREAEKIEDPEIRQIKLQGLQNSFSTKQSIIRKKYGIKLRQRRTRAEIDAERKRLSMPKHPLANSPVGTPTSNKRQRNDQGYDPPYFASQVAQGAQPGSSSSMVQTPAPIPVPEYRTNQVPMSNMNNAGLSGSSATAAVTDPTLHMTPPTAQNNNSNNSLSSYQKKGYRVSSHFSGSSQPSPSTSLPAGAAAVAAVVGPSSSSANPVRSGSASEPVLLDDDSSDSDSDEDIPADLPVTMKS